MGLHGDVDGASATLQAAWPQPHLTSPTSSRPGLRCVFCGINPGRVSAAAAAHFANPRNDFWRLLHDGGFTPRLYDPQEQFALLELGYGVTNAAYRTTPGSGDLRRGDFDAARLETIALELRPRAIAFVGKEAYRGAFGERPELGPQTRTLGDTALFVLPSTSPANAAVPYAERLRWFEALHTWLEPRQREAVRALVVDAEERVLLMRWEHTPVPRGLVDHAGRRRPGGRERRGRAAPRALRGGGPAPASTLGPAVWRREHVPALRRPDRRASASASTSLRVDSHEVAPTLDLATENVTGWRWWTLDELDGDRRADLAARPGAAPARRCSATAHPRSRSTSASSLSAVHEVFVIVHLLAAMVWVGGSIALVFAGVPAIRVLEGEPRGKAMKELGLRWRPLGYGALTVAALTGVELARYDWSRGRSPFETVLWVKIALSIGLITASYLHNFVYGPRLQPEISEGRPQATRPTLVVIGWTSLSLTIAVPILGAVLANLAS